MIYGATALPSAAAAAAAPATTATTASAPAATGEGLASLRFTASAYGYMLTYSGKTIGGAGAIYRDPKSAEASAQDLAANSAAALLVIEDLKRGAGAKRYWDAMARIDLERRGKRSLLSSRRSS